MTISNFDRLVQLADEVFAYKNDPQQLDVDPAVLERLREIHPATLAERMEDNGPVAWVLVIPTTLELMNRFLKSEISEKELFDLTPTHSTYEALYLCSALVLKEHQKKGIGKDLTFQAVEKIRKDHPLRALFVWVFTKEGEALSQTIARLTSLPLYKRPEGK